MKNKILSLVSFVFILGCAGGTTTGNIGLILLKSTPYTATAKMSSRDKLSATALSDFKFCITQIKLEDENGENVGGTVEARLGLIDPSDNTQATTWGEVEAPVDFSLSRLHVEIHVDAETCGGANYSLSYKSTEITQDLEFTFKFDPAISLNDSDVLSLGMSNIVAALESAYQAGELDDAHITSYLEAIEGDGAEE